MAGHEEQIALYDAQYSAQAQETKAVKESLTEATMELEVGVRGVGEYKSERKSWGKAFISVG